MESFSEGKITIIISLIHIILISNYINYDTYTYYTFYTNYTTNNVCNLWICLQSFRITNMPQVLDLILLTTMICLTELAHPRHPLLGSLLQVSIPWTVIAERPNIKFDLWQVKAALEMSVTGVLAGVLFVNCVISVCVLSISHFI